MLELELILKGQVQRVGYRNSLFNYVTKSHPNVVGFVQNQADGSVLVKVYGELEDLKKIRSYAHDGISGATVRDSKEKIKSVQSGRIKYENFTIISE